MVALGTYGVASLARPFGAVILGSYMDRKGRRKGLILTLTLMAVGTVSLAITPSYATIGLLGPLIITIGRLIQGFSLGVEGGGVNVYLAEIATPKNRGFYCAWQASSQALGVMAATGLGVLLTATLTMQQMQAYGWRIPLLVGCLIIPILFWLRRSLQETEVFEKSTHARTTGEIMRILLEHWQIVLIGVLLTILNTTMFYFVNTYTALYGNLLRLDPLGNFTVALSVGTASFILLPVFGTLSDRIGRWPLLIAAPLLVLATAYPAMSWLVAAPSFHASARRRILACHPLRHVCRSARAVHCGDHAGQGQKLGLRDHFEFCQRHFRHLHAIHRHGVDPHDGQLCLAGPVAHGCGGSQSVDHHCRATSRPETEPAGRADIGSGSPWWRSARRAIGGGERSPDSV